jgi:hypothetical protein
MPRFAGMLASPTLSASTADERTFALLRPGHFRDTRRSPCVAEKERALISQRTKAGLAAAKAHGKVLGNAAIAAAAAERDEALRDVFVETAGMSLRAAPDVLNSRGIATPSGVPWGAMAVSRVRARLKV